jgi:hypothetical protein
VTDPGSRGSKAEVTATSLPAARKPMRHPGGKLRTTGRSQFPGGRHDPGSVPQEVEGRKRQRPRKFGHEDFATFFTLRPLQQRGPFPLSASHGGPPSRSIACRMRVLGLLTRGEDPRRPADARSCAFFLFLTEMCVLDLAEPSQQLAPHRSRFPSTPKMALWILARAAKVTILLAGIVPGETNERDASFPLLAAALR